VNERENWLRAVEFRRPEWVPCTVNLSPNTWRVYREDLERIVLAHPRMFPGFRGGDVDFDYLPHAYREGEHYRDSWGCLWYNIADGLEGQVVGHPLADWSALADYQAPDPIVQAERGDRDWEQAERELAQQKRDGLLTWGNGERLFDRLYFLRGFENLMLDFALEPPGLPQLIKLLLDYELRLVGRWLEIGVDVIGFHTDIGTQNSLMISPRSFRKYVKPLYESVFRPCREAGTHVFLSSDGRLLDIVQDLIECGVSVHDPQLRANTVDGIAREYKGKLCAQVDLDRQSFPFLDPRGLRRQVKEVVDVLGDPQGGLMVLASISAADVPLANIEALCEAMEDYCLG
jgi:hypothetical protein